MNDVNEVKTNSCTEAENTNNNLGGDRDSELAFSKWLTQQQNDNNIKRQQIAMELGINAASFNKIVNRNRPTYNRDIIIAIGAVLHLVPGDIDDAMYLYNFWPPIDRDINTREGVLSNLLNENMKRKVSLEELDRTLQEHGYPCLDLGKKASRKHPFSLPPSLYKVQKTYTTIEKESLLHWGDSFDSLCTVFAPTSFSVTGKMILSNTKSNDNITLISSDATSHDYQYLIDNGQLARKYDWNDTDINQHFAKLNETILNKQRHIYGVLNDTRNYKRRVSASIINDSLYIYAEVFNYKIPELGDFYTICYHHHQYEISIYKQSAFMWYYLSDDDYEKYYGKNRPQPISTFKSFTQLDEYISNISDFSNKYIWQEKREEIIELKKQVDKLYNELKEGTAKIFDNSNESPGELLEYYHVENLFTLAYSDDKDGNLQSTFLPYIEKKIDNRNILISTEDLFIARSLGIRCFEDICRLKEKYGSLTSDSSLSKRKGILTVITE